MHTPGPWEADENEAGERCIVGSDHTVVCYMSGSGPQTNADERRITAAPELVINLARILAWIGTMETVNEMAQPAIDAAYAAIRKATA